MTKIVRTKTQATGGITEAERAALKAHAGKWIANAMRTDPADPGKVKAAVHALYAAADLPAPRVVLVPSPRVMAFAGAFASAIWHWRGATSAATDAATYAATDAATDAATRAATYEATDAATRVATCAATDAATCEATREATSAATYAATDAATREATSAATYEATDAATRAATYTATSAATYEATYVATREATYAATREATYAATRTATDAATRVATDAKAVNDLVRLMIACLPRWVDVTQEGNMWSSWPCYLSSFRDVLGVDLPEHAKFAAWEACAIEGGFRYIHEKFCLVSDRPEVLKVDEQNRPHCADGPSHRWRDGWCLYHWHGTRIPDEWIEQPGSLTAAVALKVENLEQRRAACEMLGWAKILDELHAETVDADADPSIGTLLEVRLPDTTRPARFLRVRCGTGRAFALRVPRAMNTAREANAWTYFRSPQDFNPQFRT